MKPTRLLATAVPLLLENFSAVDGSGDGNNNRSWGSFRS